MWVFVGCWLSVFLLVLVFWKTDTGSVLDRVHVHLVEWEARLKHTARVCAHVAAPNA